MKLIVALGNPCDKYAKTRHNAGFMAMDFFVAHSALFSQSRDFAMSAKFDAEILKLERVIFAKPQTFMNASGSAIKRIADFYKTREILVIHDDLDLRLGVVRFKFGGGNAGHNGLKSIDALLGREYGRVRIGIGKPQNKALESSADGGDSNANRVDFKDSSANLDTIASRIDLSASRYATQNAVLDFVLGDFSDDELKALQPTFEIVANALDSFINGANIQALQNAYTRKN